MSSNNTSWNDGYWFRDRGWGFQSYDDFSTTESIDIYVNSDQEERKIQTDLKTSYATLSYIISAALVLPALSLIGRAVHKINNNKIKAVSHHLVYYTWLLVACMLICILIILNLFDNFINKQGQSKSGKTCYYIYVIYESLVAFVGLCLMCLALDMAYSVLSSTQHLVDVSRRKSKIHALCCLLIVVCFIINNIPHMSQKASFRYLSKCWKGNAYEGHAELAALIDCCLFGFVILTTSLTLLLITFIIKYKTRNNDLIVVPEYMRVLDDDIGDVAEDVQQVEGGESQARATTETPSSGVDVNLEKVDEGNGEMKRRKSSRKRFPSGKRESSSKESSCHENSGYISEGNEAETQRRQSTVFISGKRRCKSDSAMPGSRKQNPRKVLEDQVFEALENFFVTDPSKLLFKALASPKQCELSAHLIDDSNCDNVFEEETSFNFKDQDGKEFRKKNIKTHTRNVQDLWRAASCKVRGDKNHWSTSSCKEKTKKTKLDICVGFSSEKSMESFSLKENCEPVRAGTCKAKVDSDSLKTNLIELNEQTEILNSPKIIIEDVDKGTVETTHPETDEDKIAERSSVSVNVDVHCPDLNLASRKEPLLESLVDSKLDGDNSQSAGNKVTFEDDTKTKDECCLVEVDTKTENSSTKTVDENATDSVFKDIDIDNPIQLDMVEEMQPEKKKEQNVASGTKERDTGLTEEIEVATSEEKRKVEMVLFKEYCKKYLLQPYQSVVSLMLVYVVCLMPQLVLDIYRVTVGRPETVQDKTDGIISICSDAAMSVFLLGITVMFLWRYRKRRNAKTDNVSQQ